VRIALPPFPVAPSSAFGLRSSFFPPKRVRCYRSRKRSDPHSTVRKIAWFGMSRMEVRIITKPGGHGEHQGD
jgi:hypothetical protein